MVDWNEVASILDRIAGTSDDTVLDHGQKASVTELACRIRAGQRSALLADEVGMGKTRIAAALIAAVREAGGRSAIVLPAGLGAQWQQELKRFNTDDKTLLPLRSYDGFISGFLHDTDAEGSARRLHSHKEWLSDRRKQRELPENGWAAEEIIMISHSFANMQFPNRGEGPAGGWRRELLPNVARLIDGRRRNFMRENFHSGEVGYVYASRRAARHIAQTILDHELPRDAINGDQKWLSADDYKNRILPLIGYGLGQFDLIVVDEAHKARGADSSLSRILGPVSWEADDPFRLGMTATPVELDSSQWIDTLERLNGRDDDQDMTALAALTEWITGYVDVVRRIQTEELDETLTGEFETSARQFCAALRPYVLRRDKRSDPEFCVFKDSHGDYREVTDIPVSPEAEGFTRDWLRRFCAAEALSLLPQDDPRVKRVRLAVAQGYGFGFGEDEEDSHSGMTDANLVGPAGFWTEAFTAESNDIYSHPAILAAVRQIEAYTRAGEKVLVFGRFLTPMNVLTRLLDAREMLRRLRDGQHWPASGIGESNIAAVIAAMRDPDLAVAGGVDEIDVMLKTRYQEWASERRAELARLHRELEDLALEGGAAAFLSEILRHEDGKQDLQFGALLEALGGRREVAGASWTGREMLVDMLPPADSESIADIVRDRCDAVQYGHAVKVKKLLLFFNIATLLANEKSNIRFQFDSFKNDKWDMEHIRSVSHERPNSAVDRIRWLEDCRAFLATATDDKAKQLTKQIERYLQSTTIKPNDGTFEKIDGKLLAYFEEAREGGGNALSNLTLLDSRTNRSYKNAVFAIKRKILLERDQAGTYVPLCTRNVFLKCYSDTVANVIFWRKEDADDYFDAICNSLTSFLVPVEAA